VTTVTCKLPEKLAAQLAVVARQERRSKSSVLREALAERLKTKRGRGPARAFDLVGHLCGCLEGGPSDLATNPDHMKGFGE
jgi:hypothetical protein